MEERLPRKLAAILYADVAGYSRLTGEDEEGTHRRLSQYLDHLSVEVKHHQGRVVHYAGDAVLADFSTATDALACAVSIQEELATRNQDLSKQNKVEFRIGINLGEVIVDRDDIYGDGVNVAARLESLAQPGGVCVSESVRSAVGKKLSVDYSFLGEQQVKNIAEPVRAYHVLKTHDQSDFGASDSEKLTRSVAVLPFLNLSGDHEQEYFADGLTEDIITSLSMWRTFPVLSRNSTFTYKNSSVTAQQVANELGARYILEGSVRKSGKQVRITAEFIDGETGHNLWAQNFDRDLEDIFAVQDELTHLISATVIPEFEQSETKRSIRKPPKNLDAWDYYLRGLSFVHRSTKDGNDKAHELFEMALELEPDYGPALSGIAYVLNRDLLLDNTESFEKTANECLDAAKRAVDLDEAAATSRIELVRALLWCGQHEAAIQEAMRAIEYNPANATAQAWLGAALCFAGREEEGIPRLRSAIKLAPRDPRNKFFMTHLALAYLTLGQLEQALDSARSAVQGQTDFLEASSVLASILSHLNKEEEAKKVIDQFHIRSIGSIECRPFWRRYLYSKPKTLVAEGLRKAGLDWQESQQGVNQVLQQSAKPSIAVLPFDNLSGDPSQEYLSEGLSEDLITALSKIRSFTVIARNSTFAYKGKAVDVKQVADDLDVRYVLEGSVRTAGNRVRITAQLVDAENNLHIWAEKYDRELDDIFVLQDEMTQLIVGAIEPELDESERKLAFNKPPDNLDAWASYQRGVWHLLQYKEDDNKEALRFLKRAIELDPKFSSAYAYLSYAHYGLVIMGWAEDPGESIERGFLAAKKALSLDDKDYIGYFALGRILMMRREHDAAIRALEKSISLNPSFAKAYFALGMVLMLADRLDESRAAVEQMGRLSPHDPMLWVSATCHACSDILDGDRESAMQWAQKGMEMPNASGFWPHVMYAAACVGMGRMEDANKAIETALNELPSLTVTHMRELLPVKIEDSLDPLIQDLRKAGLPE